MYWRDQLARRFGLPRNKPPGGRFRFTNHALERMQADGISEHLVLHLLESPTASYEGETPLTTVYRGWSGEHPLKVVVDNKRRVVTAYIDRNLEPR